MLAQTLPSSASSSSGSSTSAAPAFSKNQRKKVRRKARKGSIASLNLSPADDCCPEENKLSRHFTTADHLARLRAYLVPPPDLPSSIRSSTWRALISGLFRYVILRIPSLALLALDADPRGDGSGSLGRVDEYMDFLEERTSLRCGEEVNRLWRGLKFAKSSPSKEDSDAEGFLGVGVLSDAIADVFRVEVGDENEEGGPKVYVELLGGRVYKEGRTAELPGEGWDLFYQFVRSRLSLSRRNAPLTRPLSNRLAAQAAPSLSLAPTPPGLATVVSPCSAPTPPGFPPPKRPRNTSSDSQVLRSAVATSRRAVRRSRGLSRRIMAWERGGGDRLARSCWSRSGNELGFTSSL
jgi:hypothetical protein